MIATISRDELKQKIDHRDEFTLVDALPEETFQEGHLPGAINVPQQEVGRMAKKVIPDKEAEIVVYCASQDCHAAEKTAEALMKKGYSHVRHYAGGKKDWQEAGFPLEAQVAESHSVGP